MPPVLPKDVDAKTFLLNIPYAFNVSGFASLSRIKPNPAVAEPGKRVNPTITKSLPYAIPDFIDTFVADAARFNGEWNLYYGVCPMRQKWPHPTGKLDKDGKPEMAYRGTIENADSCCFLWLDADYKTVSVDHAAALAEYIKRLKSFPLRPTAAVMSGGGLQVMWGLKEPATGEELKRISPINEAIAKALGGDHVQDLARILRLPGTLNIKKRCTKCGDCKDQRLAACPKCGGAFKPPVLAEVIVWRPDARYNLSDFDLLNVQMPASSVAVPQELPTASPPPPADFASAGLSEDARHVIAEGLPAYIAMLKRRLPEPAFEERKRNNLLSRSEQDAWVLHQLLAVGFNDEQIYAIYRDPKNRCGEKYRERKDGDKYLGTTIKNAREFREKHPKTSAETAAVKIGTAMEKRFGDAKIEILKIVVREYDKEPIHYVTTRLIDSGVEKTTVCNGSKEIMHYKFFRETYHTQHHFGPPPIDAEKWIELQNNAPWEIQKVDKHIAGPRGEIEDALSEWLENRKLKDKNSESAIKHLPLYDEKSGRIMFRTGALLKYLKDSSIPSDRLQVIDVLKSLGYEQKSQRFGGRALPLKVWQKEMENGHASPGPESVEPPPTDDEQKTDEKEPF